MYKKHIILNICLLYLYLQQINANKMKKYIELKVYKSGKYEYLYLYYKQRANAIRINTGYKYKPELMDKNYNFIDNNFSNGKIRQLKDAVNEYLTYCYVWKLNINQKDCLIYLKQHYDNNIRAKEDNKQSKTVLQYLQDFVDLKTMQLNNDNSVKVYNNLLKNLKTYNADEYQLTFDSINNLEFFYKFRNYSIETLKHIDNTISKNIAILKAFLRHLQDLEVYTFKTALFNFSIKKTPSQVVTLDMAELSEINNCKKYDKFERVIIDVFIFLCMTSIRYSDYVELEKATITDNVLTKKSKKTGTPIRVPLNKTALDILEKYNYQLPIFANQYLNKEIKAIFLKYNLLNTEYKKTSIQNKKSIVIKKLKRDFITVHKSRSTFITLLINNNIALTEIMSITGHKYVSTLNQYTNKQHNPNATNNITL